MHEVAGSTSTAQHQHLRGTMEKKSAQQPYNFEVPHLKRPTWPSHKDLFVCSWHTVVRCQMLNEPVESSTVAARAMQVDASCLHAQTPLVRDHDPSFASAKIPTGVRSPFALGSSYALEPVSRRVLWFSSSSRPIRSKRALTTL